MFNPEFYPTPAEVIEIMLQGEEIENKTILQPTATGYTTTSLLTGEKMRTYALRTLIEFSLTNNVPLQLRYLTLEYNMSRGHLV